MSTSANARSERHERTLREWPAVMCSANGRTRRGARDRDCGWQLPSAKRHQASWSAGVTASRGHRDDAADRHATSCACFIFGLHQRRGLVRKGLVLNPGSPRPTRGDGSAGRHASAAKGGAFSTGRQRTRSRSGVRTPRSVGAPACREPALRGAWFLFHVKLPFHLSPQLGRAGRGTCIQAGDRGPLQSPARASSHLGLPSGDLTAAKRSSPPRTSSKAQPGSLREGISVEMTAGSSARCSDEDQCALLCCGVAVTSIALPTNGRVRVLAITSSSTCPALFHVKRVSTHASRAHVESHRTLSSSAGCAPLSQPQS